MAERVGFEPTVEFPLHSLSRRALSTAQTPLRGMVGLVRLAKPLESHNGEGACLAPTALRSISAFVFPALPGRVNLCPAYRT